MTRILLLGAGGRLGSVITRVAEQAEPPQEWAVVPFGRGEELEERMRECEVVVDVSHHSLTLPLVQAAGRLLRPVVIGTTGHSRDELQALRDLANRVPVVLAPNFSVGVTLLAHLVKQATAALGDGYDVEIVEMHHRRKLDSPSGTARRLAEAVCEARGVQYEEVVVDGRVGEVGQRPRGEIGMHAVRGGDVVGDHIVMFAADGERVELVHKASSRETFAVGALRAARWVLGKEAGWYSMEQVLGIR